MTFEKAIKQLRLQKFKLERPTTEGVTPPFMADWDENRISAYYEKQAETVQALEFAIEFMKNAKDFKKKIEDFSALFDEIGAESEPKRANKKLVTHT